MTPFYDPLLIHSYYLSDPLSPTTFTFLYNLCSIFGSIVGLLQSFGWSVRITYPKLITIYSLVGTCCIP